MNEDFQLKVSERIGALDQKAEAAHDRLDRLQDDLKFSIKEISDGLKELSVFIAQELKELHEEKNLNKGMKAAAYLIASLVGGVVAAFVQHFLKGV